MDNIAFVQKVKMLCLEKNLKPSNVCVECGLGSSFLPDIKRGRVPSVDKVEKLAAYLNVSVGELLGEGNKPAPLIEGGASYPSEYDFLSPEDKALIDNMIRSLSKKELSSTASPGPSAPEDEAIDREVEEFRRRLILEKNQAEKSSQSNGAGSETA